MKPSGEAWPAAAHDLVLGWALAAAVVALPIGFFVLIAEPGLSALVPASLTKGTDLVPLAIGKDAALLANDVASRYRFGIPSVLLRTLALGIAAVAVWVVASRLREVIEPVVAGPAAVLAAVIVWGSWQSLAKAAGANAVRRLVFDEVLARAEGVELVPEATLADAKAFVAVNQEFAYGGTLLLLLAVFVLTSPAAGGWLTLDRLRRRRRHLNTLLLLGVAFLVTVIATERAMLSWPLVLLQPVDGAAPFAPMADALATYWGAAATAVLLLAFGPAFFAHMLDARRAAALALPEGSEQDRSKWLDDNGLAIKPLEVTARLAVTLGPLLTVPALELLGALSP